ncbi:amidase signature enzyme [Melanomma pulvis-pyrius CBS 109.77]|uniref:Amidase signature enzyme n=1 Tax=Melanomma pulvis-pyrius CBS 109.77 TaxID=1314802 RepID=A0A6A6XB19_9PLEO|nr:amidase signature enzyme [Melanomma pulvis-pyrius CBS 109.77]
MASKIDVLTLTATDIRRLLDDEKSNSVELTTVYLDQIEKHNHAGLKLNAVISTAPLDRVLKHAQKLDDERARGTLRGPLHGVPILVKDAYSTPDLGMPTTCGSIALTEAKAKANAKIIDMLIAAGMIVIGKANMSELGNQKGFGIMAGWSAAGGQTQTPYVEGGVVPDLPWLGQTTPAGSSSGSAAGVAAGFAPISLGTESDGSIIMPACRAGLYALKLTPGSVDNTGVQPAAPSFDCLGGFAKNVRDLAHLVAIIQGHEPGKYISSETSWEGLKIGFSDPTKWRSYPSAMETVDGYWEQTDKAMFDAAEKIRALGGKVVLSVPVPSWEEITGAMPDLSEIEDLYPAYEFKQCFPEFLQDFENGPKTIAELIEFNKAHADLELPPGKNNQDFLELARDDNTTKDVFERNMNALREFASSKVKGLLHEHDLDVILGPCDSRTGSVGSASGFPVGNLPLGFAEFNGRPFALHMLAPENQEAKMFRIMAAWEATFPENVRPPPLLVAE